MDLEESESEEEVVVKKTKKTKKVKKVVVVKEESESEDLEAELMELEESEEEEEEVEEVEEVEEEVEELVEESEEEEEVEEEEETEEVEEEVEEETEEVEEEETTEKVEELKEGLEKIKKEPITNTPSSTDEVFELFLGNFPFEATEEEIKGHFKHINGIVDLKLLYRPDGRSKGKGFLKLNNLKAQEEALKLHDQNFQGRRLFIEKSKNKSTTGNKFEMEQGNNPENTSIIVRNLPFTMDDGQFEDIFKPCGAVKNCRIIMSREDGRSRGFGFVDFFDIESARNALKKHNEKYGGRPINVDYSRPRTERPNRNGGGGGYNNRNSGGGGGFGSHSAGGYKFGGNSRGG